MDDDFTHLKRLAARVKDLRGQLTAAEAARDGEIRGLLQDKRPAKDIAEAADLHVKRVYQIRDDRR